MFKPLIGSEENKWLEEKYADIDEDSLEHYKYSESRKPVLSKCSGKGRDSKHVSRSTKINEEQQVNKRFHGSTIRARACDEQKKSEVDIFEEEEGDTGNESIFRPLSGNEEANRLKVKYSESDVFEVDDSADEFLKCTTSKKPKLMFITPEKTSNKQRGTPKSVTRKGVKSAKSQLKKTNYGGHGYSSDSEDEGKDFTHIKTTSNNSDVEVTDDDTADWVVTENRSGKFTNPHSRGGKSTTTHSEGYNEEDFEKPRFECRISSAAKVPFKLCDPTDDRQVEVPAPLNQHLRDYQREGIQFLYDHYKKGSGAVLGDDMGLGKTVQVIGLLAALLGKQCNKKDIMKQKPKFIREMSDSLEEKMEEDAYKCQPFLVIGPGSVLYNWMDEFEAWGYFRVGKYHGNEKAECLHKLGKHRLEIVVTTFETFRENMDELNSFEWEAVITDEVHRIKGLQAQVTNALRSIKTRRRYGLTGTALQNNMKELWSILDWVQPGCLGSIDTYIEKFVVPIETGQKLDASKRELALARKVKEKFAAIRNKIMIRRTKQLIADQLPQKDDNVVFCRLSDLQEQVYRFILAHPGLVHVMSMDEPCHCGSGEARRFCCKQVTKEVTVTGVQFIFMHLLLKVSNHAALLIENPNRQVSKYSQMICKAVFQEFPHFYHHTQDSAFRTLSDPKYCGKMKILQRLLKVFQKDHSKVLLFSYSTRVLDIIDQYLITTGYEYRRLDGSTSMSKRSVLVREFNKDPNIFLFLISAKAGGLGLNLTGANRVIIFDPSWNPTNDLQAQDRAYRIGQWRDVHVYRLISAGTIEENIYLRQVYKQQLDSVAVGTENARRYFRGIAGDRKRHGELFGIKNMFQLHTGDSSRTMDILKKNENLERSLTDFKMAKYVPGTTGRVSVEEDLVEDTEEDSVEEEEDCLSKYLDLHYSDSDPDVFSRSSVEGRVKRKRDSTEKRKRDGTEKRKKDGTEKDSPTKAGTVLEDDFVVHVLKNRQIVGGSRAEDHMSRCAMQDVFELHQNSQEPAAHCQPLSEPESEDEKTEQVTKKRNIPYSTTIGTKRVLVGQTPPTIRTKLFKEMTKFHKKRTVVDFAEEVLRSSPEGRKTLLESYYTQLQPYLSSVFHEAVQEKNTASDNCRRPGKSPKASGRKKRKAPAPQTSPTPAPVVSHVSEVTKHRSKAISKTREPFFVPRQIELYNEESQEVSHDSFDVSTDDLLQEICYQSEERGVEKGDCGVKIEDSQMNKSEKPSTSTVSVLDELFSPSVRERMKRKPAPKKNRQSKKNCDGSDDLFTDSFSTEEEVEEWSKIRTDNTLKDEDVDCFTEPSRRRKRRSNAQVIVSRLIEESEATYRRLPVVPIGSELDEVDSCDRSPSLF
ncbi:DNA excision repair protein ERCC-6-like 2 isoform X3 [Ostrea edulis]|nr:DNA excision repair protein ERCC-6-like 2 isoform X3 [Ostrea edulis]